MTRQYDSRTLYMRLLRRVHPYWKALVLALIATTILAATEPLFPALLRPLLDEGFAQRHQVEHPILIPLGIIAVFIVRGGFNYLSSFGFSWVSNRVITDIRAEMYARMVNLPIGYFQQHTSSVPLTKIAYDVNGVASAATSVTVTVLKDGLSVVGLLIWLLWLNWQLTLICFALIPAIAWVMRTFSGRLRKASRNAQISTASMVQVLQETALCARVIKVFCGEQQEIERFLKTSNEVYRQNMRQAIAAAATSPIVHLFASVAVAVVIYTALVQSAAGHTTVGSFVSFITALLMLLSPLRHLADVSAPLQRGLAAAESVFQLLDESPETDPGTRDIGRAAGRLEFRALSFRYPGAERDALADVSFEIAPGETVALIGQSGGGKSTLAALLPRFYNPSGGRILLDGIDLQEIALHSLRKNIAFVSQEVLLFNDTIAANIAYGDMANAPREMIERAAAAANAL